MTVISYEEAVRRELPVVQDFRPPTGVRRCSREEISGESPRSEVPPPDKASVCWAAPEDQGLRIVLNGGTRPDLQLIRKAGDEPQN